MNILNGKIIYRENTIYVNSTTYNLLTDQEYDIVTTGTSTLVLPSLQSGLKYNLVVKSGTCQITGTVDGVANPVYDLSDKTCTIICNGIGFYIINSDKCGYEVNTKSKLPQKSSYTQAGVITINTVIMTVDCGDAASISISCQSMGTTGVVTPRWRNNVGETPVGATIVTPAGVSVTTFNAVGIWTTPVFARYLDLVLTTATTGGTTTINVNKLFGQTPIQLIPPIGTQPVSGTVTANIGTGALASGSNQIGDVGVVYRTSFVGGASVVSILSPATPAAGMIKASGGRLVGWQLTNTSGGLRSVKIFNSSAPTLGTSTATFEIDIPAGQHVNVNLPGGIGFSSAMTWSVTSAKGLTDNTSTGLAANDVSGSIFFA